MTRAIAGIIGAQRNIGAAAWTPASLGANLYTWNKHTDLPTSGAVSLWSDDGGTGITTLTSSLTARPTAGVEANGLRFLTFDGTANYMTFAGNPLNPQPNSVDLRDTVIGGLCYAETPLGSDAVILGSGAGLNVYPGFAPDEQHGFAVQDFGTAAGSIGCYWRGNPRQWMGGTPEAPFTSLSGVTTFTSGTDQITTGVWFSYILYLPGTSAAKVMINARSNVVMQATAAQNVPVLVKHLGGVYSAGTAALSAFFKGRISEFFGGAVAAADNATIDQMFGYLNALKPA